MADNKPQSFDDGMHRLGEFFQGLSLQQRLLLVAGVGLIAGTLWVFVTLLGQPKYVTLYSGLRPEDAQAMGGKLAAKNIPYQISPDGSSLLVPEDKLDASRLETAAAGLPRSARLGFELFDTPNWAGSDFTEKVNYQRALEGELERTLGTLSEVEGVRVHLVMAQESLFTEQEHEAKAAVIIKTRGGRLSEQAQLAIPQLVASAVEGLRPENVTVVDADSNTPLLHGRDGGRAYAPDEELAKTLVHTLEPVVGADHVRASVHVEYDLGTSEETQETYDPKTPTALTGALGRKFDGRRSGGSSRHRQQRSGRHRARPGCGRCGKESACRCCGNPACKFGGNSGCKTGLRVRAGHRAVHVEIRFDHLRHQQEPASQRGAGRPGAADRGRGAGG